MVVAVRAAIGKTVKVEPIIFKPTATGVKECIQPVRLQRNDPDCAKPYMHVGYCYAESCNKHDTDDKHRDACEMVDT
jgi:hypothetical protein